MGVKNGLKERYGEDIWTEMCINDGDWDWCEWGCYEESIW